uniref:Secreted protein n=1 Tax=Achlya hypogyna TaxID=1202772 RepID=A0A0A7CP52_ACHHY|nr:secreted protein [Achlya hypogyna]
MFGFTKLIAFCAAAVAAKQVYTPQSAIQVAVPIKYDLSASAPISTDIYNPANTFVSVHFESLNVPEGGILTLTSFDGADSVTFHGGESKKDVYAEWLTAGKGGVKVKYDGPTLTKDAGNVFVIDKIMVGKQAPVFESLCGPDKSKPAPCYADDSVKTKSGKAVARLLIGGSSLCTGWLVGSEGHLLTNHHCIETEDDAKNLQVELGAECKTCDDPNNQKQLGCKGEIVATDAKFVASDELADFTLVKLNIKDGVDIKKYGYLQIRPEGPKLNEQIHILGHAVGWPKRFAIVTQNGQLGTVTNSSIPSCQPDEFGYVLDTQGGNSGSPVISNVDNAVVGIHNCGGCPTGPNGGIKIDKVVDILKKANALPKDAIAGKPAC